MHPIVPIYVPSNCRAVYQLNWSLTAFWRTPPPGDSWFDDLRTLTEQDGVRTLEHRFLEPETSQFYLSTKPEVSPIQFTRSIKGRLQHLIGGQMPRAFQRNYAFRSIGAAKRSAVERYIESQLGHHRVADPRFEAMLQQFQIRTLEADLSKPRKSAHGLYWYNLHLVLVNDCRWREVREESLGATRDGVIRIARKHGQLLSRGAILPDHIHLALGCRPEHSPMEVALCYMNNLAYLSGMRPIFQFGFYVGTFGEYDRGVVRRGGGQSSLHRDGPGGGAGEGSGE